MLLSLFCSYHEVVAKAGEGKYVWRDPSAFEADPDYCLVQIIWLYPSIGQIVSVMPFGGFSFTVCSKALGLSIRRIRCICVRLLSVSGFTKVGVTRGGN